MLSVSNYKKTYIAACRAKIEAQLAAYKELAKKTKGTKALEQFEPLFFNNLVLVLEGYFVHRTRGLERKDGNPLNEVRLLAVSLMQNGGKLVSDKTIKYEPERAVLGLAAGAEIAITEAQFEKLFDAYLRDLEAKFS